MLRNLAAWFCENGYETILVTDFPPEEGKPCYSVPEGVRWQSLRESVNGNAFLKNLERIARLRRLLKNEQPDVVLSFLGRPNLRLLIASIGLSPRKVVSVRNDPAHEYGAGFLHKCCARLLFRLADGCVFQTPDAMRYFPKSVWRRSAVILNPVDTRFFQAHDLAEAQNLIVSVGRMEPQKNQRMLIEAFLRVAGDFPDAELVLYGDGPMRKELECMRDSSEYRDRIFLPGTVDDVADKLRTAKIFALTSDYEGLPNALMEAMASGLACISTDCPCGGPRLLIQNEKQGVLIPCGDAKKLESALRCLLENAKLCNELGRGASDRAAAFRPEPVYVQWERYLFGNE